MPIDDKFVPPHPAVPCPGFKLPSRIAENARHKIGIDAAAQFHQLATRIRDSIGHPIAAMQESAPYEEMAEAWTAWAAGEAEWIQWCGRNRRLVNKIRRSLGLDPIPARPRKKA
jgi:hypothetical protein